MNSFKIGISSTPERRASLYRFNDSQYKEMVVMYKTMSAAIVRRTERELTLWFKDDYECDNQNISGGGPLGSPPHFLSVVLRY